jgi:hypothetical protein
MARVPLVQAAETLAMLLFVVIISALALLPQDVELLGAEILVIALPLTVFRRALTGSAT